MRIGNAHYQCSCVSYLTSESNFSLIVGLSVGLGVPLIIIAIIVFTVVFVCRKKEAGQREREVSDDNAYTGPEDKTYSRPYTCSPASFCSDYENLGQYESEEYIDIKWLFTVILL